MRITYLRLPRFKNLRDFEIRLDSEPATTLIVGRNGSGKSNLLEAIVTIFRDLERGLKGQYNTAWPFEITYEIRNSRIRILHNEDRSTSFWVNEKPTSSTAFFGAGDRAYLPETVFAYYSGSSNRLEELFDTSLADFRDAMIENRKNVRQRLIYGRLIHSKFVLLSFFGDGTREPADFLSSELGIEGLESVLFVLKQPSWNRSRQGLRAKTDFWGARGVVRTFLKNLQAASMATLQLDVRVPLGIKRTQLEERVYLFVEDRDALAELVSRIAGDQGKARELFKTLESAYVSDLISDVRITVRKRSTDDTVTFRELSEGEQQLLMVLGLLRFTKDEESLFLLDEPDTHLNPAWSQRYLELIEQAVSKTDSSQVLLATHDPVAISMLERSQVRQLAIDSATGSPAVRYLDEDPVRLGVAGVLMSEIFGLRSMYSPAVQEIFEQRRALLLKEHRSAEEDAELARLTAELRDIDFASTVPDPEYVDFLRATAKRDRAEISERPVLSPEEVEEQEELTQAIVDDLAGKP